MRNEKCKARLRRSWRRLWTRNICSTVIRKPESGSLSLSISGRAFTRSTTRDHLWLKTGLLRRRRTPRRRRRWRRRRRKSLRVWEKTPGIKLCFNSVSFSQEANKRNSLILVHFIYTHKYKVHKPHYYCVQRNDILFRCLDEQDSSIWVSLTYLTSATTDEENYTQFFIHVRIEIEYMFIQNDSSWMQQIYLTL